MSTERIAYIITKYTWGILPCVARFETIVCPNGSSGQIGLYMIRPSDVLLSEDGKRVLAK